MSVVRFVTGNYPWPWSRQLPVGNDRLGDTQFVFGPGNGGEDWLVVYDEVPEEANLSFDRARSIFVASEPVNVKRYNPNFLAQFGTVLTTDHDTPHPNRVFTQLGLPWHVGIATGEADTYERALSFGDFQSEVPRKTKLCSVICSDKAFTPQHRQRLAFVQALKSALGDRIDVFGRGFTYMADKDEALADYRYHIALENCAFEDYWTEKLSDPFLRGCFPIYWGAPNIGDYFPSDALAPIDISRQQSAINEVARIIDSNVDQQSRAALDEARRRVLWEHNVFALLERTIRRVGSTAPQSGDLNAILPERAFVPAPANPGLTRRVVRRVRSETASRLQPKHRQGLASRMRTGAQYLWDWAEQLSPTPAPEKTPRELLLEEWLAAEGDKSLRQEYDLHAGDVVLDVGGYAGQWASDIVARYQCRMHVFEPVPGFAASIRKRFAANSLVTVHEAAVSTSSGSMSIAIADDASSEFKARGSSITVPVLGFAEFLQSWHVDEVALMKLNIEGGEYALLEGILNSGLMSRVRELQVQFHDFVPEAQERMHSIQRRLSETHAPTYRYEFLWENWRRKDVP